MESGPVSLGAAGSLLIAVALGMAGGCEGPSAESVGNGPVGAAGSTAYPRSLAEAHAAAMRDSVRAFLDSWSEGTDPGAWEQMLTWYADDPDFVWMEDGQVRYRSVDAIREGLDGLAGAFSRATTEFSDLSITPLAPGLANVVTRFHTTLHPAGTAGSEDSVDTAAPAAGGPPGPSRVVEYGGGMTLTVVHGANGWKVLHGHTSSATDRGG